MSSNSKRSKKGKRKGKQKTEPVRVQELEEPKDMEEEVSEVTEEVGRGDGSAGDNDGDADGDDDDDDDSDNAMDEEGVGTSCGSATKGKQKIEDKVYLPGDNIESDDELVFEPSAYQMYHMAQAGAPCLSFDVLRDSLGDNRTEYPHTLYLVTGTQLAQTSSNTLVLMKMTNLGPVSQKGEGSDSEGDDDDDIYDDDEPQMESILIKHQGGVNRIRVAPLLPEKRIVATWSDSGSVHVWDITKHALLIDTPGGAKGGSKAINEQPIYSFSGHQTEGFAMDWSPTVAGRLATGDCRKNIHVWSPQQDGGWSVDQRPFSGHTASVEDIQWSPNENTVFASCSVDKTVRVWDIRASPNKACMLTTQAHDRDVNVISWNRHDPFIVSGGDDGVLKIWDLRQFQKGATVAIFKHHSGPITSVEWHPSDSTVFASAGEDNQVVQWDLAVEKDSSEGQTAEDNIKVPPQLLFIHQGQKEIKEIHWHPQIPGVVISTAETGFNVFRTISV